MNDPLHHGHIDWETIFNAIGHPTVIIDVNHRIIAANSATISLTGMPNSGIIGRQCYEIFHGKGSSSPARGCPMEQMIHSGRLETTEMALEALNGIFLVSCTPILNDRGELEKVIHIATDISERKKAENALRASEATFRTTLESIPFDVFVLNRDGSYIMQNSVSRQWWGEIVGKRPEDITDDPAKLAIWRSNNQRALAGEVVKAEESFVINDEVRHVYNIIAPVRDGDEVNGIVGMNIDITENKRVKQALDEQLQQTQRMESIGTLAGGIAHDFNNLLQGVFGYLQMARLLIDDRKKAIGMLEQAEQALMMSVNLSSQLLTFAKGGKPVKKQIGLKPVIDNSVKFALSGAWAEANLDIAADLWQVMADEGQLAQVIQNIVLNANEAQPNGGTIAITAVNVNIPKGMKQALPDGGRYVLIAVRDSGLGIPPQHLTRIFEPYFTTKQRGSGIGLATSYSIIKNHGGTIEVASETNKGSTFSIYLPAAETDGQTANSAVIGKVAPHLGRILLLDDEEVVRTVVMEMLTALGHEVECAAEGKEAIEKFLLARKTGRSFDLLIFDLTVKGGMGGEEAIRRIQEIEPHVTAVVSSGYSDSPVLSDFRAYGFSASLQKPFTIEAVNDCLNTLLGKQA